MGACSCIPHRREFYTDVDSEEEASIRRWEENLGAFSKTFNEVSRKICFEKNESDPAYVESLFREVFGEQILTLLRKDFFKHKNKNGISEEYNSKKLERFIFLISRPEKLKSIKMHYWDKALYVFHDAKRNEEEDLNTPVEKSDKDLIKFLDDLIDISVIILEFYYESYPSRRSEIDILKNKRQLIADFLLKNLNSKKEPKIQTNSISFSELNKLFDDDLWILTPGHIREAAKEIEKMEMLKK